MAETLQRATIAPEGSVWYNQMMPFVEAVNNSGTDLTIEVFAGGQLGNMEDTFRNTLSGRTDIWSGVIPVMSAVVPELGIYNLPYLFADNDELKCIIPQMVDATRALVGDRFAILTIVPVGSQNIEGISPIRVPSDLQGVPMRSAPVGASMAFFQSLGATPQPLPAPETPSAVNTGLVTALDFDYVYLFLTGVHRTARYLTTTSHNQNLGGYVVSPRTWARLNEAQQQALVTAAQGIDFGASVDGIAGFQDMMAQRAVADGAEMVNLIDDERAQWIAAGRAIWGGVLEGTRGDPQAFLAQIEAARLNCN